MQLRWDEIDAVVWDFNGTLLDDLDLVVRSVNTQLTKRGHPPLTSAEYRDVFGFPVEDYYRRIGLTFETESMAELSADFFAEYEPHLQACSLQEGVLEVIDALARRSVRQFVLSAMEEGMLQETLKSLGIAERFVGAYGLAHLEGDSKISRGRQLLEDFDLLPKATLMVGDTDHDAEVAHALDMNVLLVSTGHQSKAKLRATGCPVIDRLSEITFGS